MRKLRLLISGVAALAVMAFPALASADSLNINFESYTPGNINGQDDWSKTGAYDVAVANNTYGFGTFGSKSLRISDAVTSGSFGDQTFSKSLTNEAGEADALNGGFSGGARQPHFEAQFDLASTMATLQPGMHVSVSPDRGDGARMSYLRFEDQSDGIHVFFDDVQGTTNPANFVETDIATISRAPHTIKFSMDFLNGPSNDVVKIYIDGNLVKTGTSWENYYRFDSESNPTLVSNSRTVDSLLFRESGDANAADAGNGFLIDNLSLSSGPIAPAYPTSKDQCKDGGWKQFTNPSFKNQGQCIDWVNAKASGDLRMGNPHQRIRFNVANLPTGGDHDRDHRGDDRDKNTVEYWNYDYPGGLQYEAAVACSYVNPQTDEARFMFQIPAGHPGLSGLYVVSYVKHVKHAPDLYGHAATGDVATAAQWCQTGDGFSPTMYPVTKGDVEVE